jgi:hypothetical protein
MSELPQSAEVVHRIHDDLSRLIGDENALNVEASKIEDLPSEIAESLTRVTAKPDSYRDALLVLLAFSVLAEEIIDLRRRPERARAAGDSLGRLLPSLHIRSVKGAFQNIGKNTEEMVRGNNLDFDSILIWASTEATLGELTAAYCVVVGKVASTARPVEERPTLVLGQLTFPKVMAMFEEMLSVPSGGAYEQYVVSALLEAALSQEGSNRRVTTKGLSTSDKSAKSAGDIEILERGRLQEGIEVTANQWEEKIEQAKLAISEHGLSRSHIVAAVEGDEPYEALRELVGDSDVSLVDVKAAVGLLTALLVRGGRHFALLRTYELLDQHLADPSLVNAYVALLKKRGLAE